MNEPRAEPAQLIIVEEPFAALLGSRSITFVGVSVSSTPGDPERSRVAPLPGNQQFASVTFLQPPPGVAFRAEH